MNPKITGIIVLVFGLGVVLYLVNSGAVNKVASLFASTTSGHPTTTITAVRATTGAGATSPATSSSSTSPWVSFFQSLFAPHKFTSLPVVGGGTSGGSSGGSQSYYGQTSSGGNTGSYNANSSGVTPPAGFSANQLSPYYGDVRFTGVSQSEITVSTYPAFGAPTSTVDITGWQIKTNRGGEYIPRAQNIYAPTGEGVLNDIILTLSPGRSQYVNIYSNSAPTNLRVNECMGYLNATGQFQPGFTYQCPPIDRSQLSQFTGACQNYITSLYNCQQPDFGSYYFPRNDYQCQDYLKGKYNYNWCVATYGNDPSFLGNEWRLWMGASPLDPYHDNVELLDRNGLLVDYYHY